MFLFYKHFFISISRLVLEKNKTIKNNDINLYPISEAELSENLQIDWPGEYEAQQVLIKSLAEEANEQEFRHFLFEIDGNNVAYVANSGNKPSKEILDLLSHADVLLITTLLDTQTAVDLVETIEPNDAVIVNLNSREKTDAILKEIARPELESQEKIVIKKTDLEEQLLNYHILSL